MDNENKFELNGETYVAKPYGGCNGCAFKYEYNFCGVVACRQFSRKDGISVIFVKANSTVIHSADRNGKPMEFFI